MIRNFLSRIFQHKIFTSTNAIDTDAILENNQEDQFIQLDSRSINSELDNINENVSNITNELHNLAELASKLANDSEYEEVNTNYIDFSYQPTFSCSLDGVIISYNEVFKDFFRIDENSNWIGKNCNELEPLKNFFNDIIEGNLIKVESNTTYTPDYKIYVTSNKSYRCDFNISKVNEILINTIIPIKDDCVKILKTKSIRSIIDRRSTKAIVAFNTNGTIVYYNALFSKVLCNGENFEGRNILEIVPRNTYKGVMRYFKSRKLLEDIEIEVNGTNYKIILDDYIVNGKYIHEVQIYDTM